LSLALELEVNGRIWSGRAPARLTLADLLREHLGLKGTHLGCEQGVCGACNVLLDGRAVRSCLLLAAQAEGHRVTTVEGLAASDGLSELQRQFVERAAFQCGFCTPGFLVAGEELIRSGRAYTREELRDLLSSNICRCTGYTPIVDAVQACLA
jgi:aerobic-type carbon monoxide dehydrogenase small subunit (CoxS/CutS family)